MPPGVLNVVHGYGPDSAGAALTSNPDVERITFTGESGTGKIISAAASRNLVPVSLELGGKGANIVFDDAELDNAVHWAVQAIFRNAGQICLSGSRLYLQAGIYDEFVERFVKAAEALKAGDPKDPSTEFPLALASQEHFDKVSSYLGTIEQDGGRIVTGGLGDGWSVKPTIILDAPPTARVCREEIFGPVCVVQRFETEDDVVHAANDTRYGLNAMVFTENLSRAHRVAAKLQGRHRVGELLLHPRPAGAVRRRRRVRGRARGRQLQPGVLHRAEGRRHADHPLLQRARPATHLPLGESVEDDALVQDEAAVGRGIERVHDRVRRRRALVEVQPRDDPVLERAALGRRREDQQLVLRRPSCARGRPRPPSAQADARRTSRAGTRSGWRSPPAGWTPRPSRMTGLPDDAAG